MSGVFRSCVTVRALALAGPIDNLVLHAVPLPELRRLPQLTSTTSSNNTIFTSTTLEIDLTCVAGGFSRFVIIFCSVLYYIM